VVSSIFHGAGGGRDISGGGIIINVPCTMSMAKCITMSDILVSVEYCNMYHVCMPHLSYSHSAEKCHRTYRAMIMFTLLYNRYLCMI
jgi:hypothetical protein